MRSYVYDFLNFCVNYYAYVFFAHAVLFFKLNLSLLPWLFELLFASFEQHYFFKPYRRLIFNGLQFKK